MLKLDFQLNQQIAYSSDFKADEITINIEQIQLIYFQCILISQKIIRREKKSMQAFSLLWTLLATVGKVWTSSEHRVVVFKLIIERNLFG